MNILLKTLPGWSLCRTLHSIINNVTQLLTQDTICGFCFTILFSFIQSRYYDTYIYTDPDDALVSSEVNDDVIANDLPNVDSSEDDFYYYEIGQADIIGDEYVERVTDDDEVVQAVDKDDKNKHTLDQKLDSDEEVSKIYSILNIYNIPYTIP